EPGVPRARRAPGSALGGGAAVRRLFDAGRPRRVTADASSRVYNRRLSTPPISARSGSRSRGPATINIKKSQRIQGLQPYLFASIDRVKKEIGRASCRERV